MAMKYHVEANGKKTLICELENSHLINILKLFSNKLYQAKEVLENGKTMKFKNAFYGKVLNVEDAEQFTEEFIELISPYLFEANMRKLEIEFILENIRETLERNTEKQTMIGFEKEFDELINIKK